MPKSGRRQRYIEDNHEPPYGSKVDRRTSSDHILARVIWPIIRIIGAVMRSLTWERFFKTAQIAATTAAILIVIIEGFYAAAYNERVVRRTDEIEFPLQGLQASASIKDLAAAESFSGQLAQKVSVRSVVVDDVSLHPVGAVLVKVIRTHGIRSMIDWPCREHRDIVPAALRLAMATSTKKEVDSSAFHYFCLDSDSNELTLSRNAVRNAIGSRQGLNYILQQSFGSFRLGQKTSPIAKPNIHPVSKSHSFSGYAPNSRSSAVKKELSSSKVLTRTKTGRPELIFSWGGRSGGPNSTTEVRELVLSAAASGASLALIGAHAAYGTKWERPNETMASVDDLTTGRLNGAKMPWFPFGNAVVSVTAEHSPLDRTAGNSDPRFLVLYRLDAIPPILVKTQSAEYSDDISIHEVSDYEPQNEEDRVDPHRKNSGQTS